MPVPSTSGQAVLTLPLLVPLSDLIGLSRQVTVLAYQYGAGLCEVLTPTNGALMAMLADRLAPAPVMRGSDLGWMGDAIEAQAFAYLAVRSLKGMPLTFPGTTGAPVPLTGGVLAKP